jgi:hypothetical protein
MGYNIEKVINAVLEEKLPPKNMSFFVSVSIIRNSKCEKNVHIQNKE